MASSTFCWVSGGCLRGEEVEQEDRGQGQGGAEPDGCEPGQAGAGVGRGRLRARTTVGGWRRPGSWRCRCPGHRQGLAEERRSVAPTARRPSRPLGPDVVQCATSLPRVVEALLRRSVRTDARWPAWPLVTPRDRRDRHLEAWDPRGKLRALACRRIRREPAQPLLVHAAEVVLVREHDRGTDDLVQRAAGLLEDRGDVLQALACLFLDGSAQRSGRLTDPLVPCRRRTRALPP